MGRAYHRVAMGDNDNHAKPTEQDADEPRQEKAAAARPETTPRTKQKIRFGLALVLLISVGMGLASGFMSGIAYFFILTVLLWAIAKTRRWI
jgi:hypothetical protein